MEQLTLLQLNQLIKSTLENHLDSSYWVVAEIGELRVNRKGHCYMEFVEKEGPQILAKLRANLWAYDFYNLNSLFRSVTGQPLGVGMKILARVMVQFHEVYGLSLLVKDLDANFTLGERARQKQLVIERLTSEGIMDRNTLLSLPMVPQRVAVVSSKTAAGFGDFMDQLVNNPNGYQFKIALFETVMQGDHAAGSMVNAIKKAIDSKQQFDLLVIIRGGGSQLDLDCFDNYELAAEIARCRLPVLTGIGHQRDDTIADKVAHTNLKTPTAVAEFLINGMKAFEAQIDYHMDRIKKITANQMEKQRTSLFGMLQGITHGARMAISINRHNLELSGQQLKTVASAGIKDQQVRLLQFEQRFSSQSNKIVAHQKLALDLLQTKLVLADPVNILKKGYSITYLNGKAINKETVLEEGDQIDTRIIQKRISSTVTSIKDERAKDEL